MKIAVLSFILTLILTIPLPAQAADSYTLTTYYPAPNGKYNNLTTNDFTCNGTTVFKGNVGIGTTDPRSLLDVHLGVSDFRFSEGLGNLTPNITIVNTDPNGRAGGLVAGTDSAGFHFSNNGFFDIVSDDKARFLDNTVGSLTGAAKVIMRVLNTGAGRIGIGMGAADPTYTLQVTGTTRFDGNATIGNAGATNTITGTTTLNGDTTTTGKATIGNGAAITGDTTITGITTITGTANTSGLLSANGGFSTTSATVTSLSATGNISTTGGTITASGNIATTGGSISTPNNVNANTFSVDSLITISSDATHSGLFFSSPVTTPAFYHSSDQRLKTHIRPIKDALGLVNALNGKRFDFKKTGRPGIGLIAQDVEKVLPELVSTGDDGMKSVAYANIVAVLIEAVKEQERVIKTLSTRVDAQEQEIRTLRKK